jgi:hypothetical protein
MVDSTNKSNEIEEGNKSVEFLNEKLGEDTSKAFKSVKYASALEMEKKKKGVY